MGEQADEIVAVVHDYDGLIAALVARRNELRLPQLLVDDIAGLQSGYVAKLERKIRGLGSLSLSCLLPALGLELVVRRTVPHHQKHCVALADG